MKMKHSAFYWDTVKLSWGDMLRLLLGREVRASGVSVGLWRMPDDGRPPIELADSQWTEAELETIRKQGKRPFVINYIKWRE